MKEYTREFPSDDVCLEWIKGRCRPKGIFCLQCRKITKHYRLKSRRCYSCEYCGHQVYPVAGTIFHKSRTPLTSWFYAIFLFASRGGAVTGKELERKLRVTYKCAWRIVNQVRFSLNEEAMARVRRGHPITKSDFYAVLEAAITPIE